MPPSPSWSGCKPSLFANRCIWSHLVSTSSDCFDAKPLMQNCERSSDLQAYSCEGRLMRCISHAARTWGSCSNCFIALGPRCFYFAKCGFSSSLSLEGDHQESMSWKWSQRPRGFLGRTEESICCEGSCSERGKSKALWDTLRHERKWRGPRLYSKHEGGNMEMERNGLAKVVENQLRHAGDGACVAACFVWDQRYPSFDHLLRNGRMLKTWGATCLCLLHGILVSTLPGPCCFCWTFSKWPNLFMKTSHDQNTTDFRPRYNAALGGLLWFLNSKVFYFLHVHTSFWFIHNLSQFSIFQSVQRCSKPLYRVTSFGPGYQLQIWRTFLEDGQVLGTPCRVHCTSNFCICSILNLDMYSLSSLVTCQSCQSCQPCQPCQCCQPCQSCHFLLNNFCVHLSVGRPVLASL